MMNKHYSLEALKLSVEGAERYAPKHLLSNGNETSAFDMSKDVPKANFDRLYYFTSILENCAFPERPSFGKSLSDEDAAKSALLSECAANLLSMAKETAIIPETASYTAKDIQQSGSYLRMNDDRKFSLGDQPLKDIGKALSNAAQQRDPQARFIYGMFVWHCATNAETRAQKIAYLKEAELYMKLGVKGGAESGGAVSAETLLKNVQAELAGAQSTKPSLADQFPSNGGRKLHLRMREYGGAHAPTPQGPSKGPSRSR